MKKVKRTSPPLGDEEDHEDEATTASTTTGDIYRVTKSA
jgi:hypothetical protein